MKQSAQEIDEEAANWAAKVDRGLSTEEQAELDRWLTKDVRRIGAYGRIRAIALQTERVAALGPVHSPPEFVFAETPRMSRRRLLGRGAVAAGLGAVGLGGWLWLTQGRFHTRKGEVRQLALGDGSVVTLNTSSEVAVRLERSRREVRLLAGEALFDVAPDRARPFVVIAGETQARVVGTSFIVRALPGEPVQILVREGMVDVSRSNGAVRSPIRLLANMRAVSRSIVPDGAADALSGGAVSEATVQRALAWRDGQVDLEGETLGQAAIEFGRYSDMRIVVDPRLANEEIAGVYLINDPVGFAKAVAVSLRANTEIADGEIRIY